VPKPLPEKAIELPGRNAKPAPKKPVRDPQLEARIHKLEKQLLSPPNAIPNGAGGPVKGPYGNFQNDAGTGGFAFSPNAGDFGTRYGWYVTAIRSRISSNWLKGTVDPTVQVAPRVYVVFEINRDGQLVNAQVTQPSGIASLDRSALRAVLDSNPMPALPADYRGSSVAVEFWFEFRR
jgi:TonB family protein